MRTLVMFKKILQSGKPEYITDQMIHREAGGTRSGTTQSARTSLTISREGFLHRGRQLLNSLLQNIRNEGKIRKFKIEAKAWVKLTIAVKP